MKYILLFFATFLLQTTIAQKAESIATNRPGQSNGAETVGPRVLQVEHGFGASQDKLKIVGRYLEQSNVMYNTNVFRYGVSKRMELNWTVIAGTETYIKDSLDLVDINLTQSGKSIYNFGLRGFMFEQKGARPALGLGANFAIPDINFVPEFSQWTSSINLVATYGFDSGFGITSNINVFAERIREPEYTLNFHYTYKKMSVFFENYGNLSKLTYLSFDGGVQYLFGNNIAVDVSGGYSFWAAGFRTGYFAELGFSWRIGGSSSPSDASNEPTATEETK